MAAAITWLWSDRGLLVVGTSLLLGALGYIWADCLRLWRVRRKMRDGVDLAATSIFIAMIAGVALVLHTFSSLPAASVGVLCAAVSYAGLRRALRLTTG